jgi:hypothetical protein
VRGYLESLTEMELINELQSALKHARRLTSKDWTIVITAGDIAIQSKAASAEPRDRIKIPRPKSLEN